MAWPGAPAGYFKPYILEENSCFGCAVCCIFACFFVIGIVVVVVLVALSEGEGPLGEFDNSFDDQNSDHYTDFFGTDCNEHDNLPKQYRGEAAITQTGLKCMEWNMQYPHSHGLTPEKESYRNKGIGYHNYCRNPDDEPNGAWCYTMDPKVRWEYCACCK